MNTTSTDRLTPATAPAAPNPAPVYMVGENTPGYLPDPDSVHAVHVRRYSTVHFDDDVRALTNALVDLMREALENSIESIEADMRAFPGDTDPDADPTAGDAGLLESLEYDRADGRTGEMYADILHAVAAAVRAGGDCGYTLNLGNNDTVSFYAALCADPAPTCSEYDEYDACPLDLCGPAGPLVIDPDDVDNDALFVHGTPVGPVGYRVTIEQAGDPGESPRTWDGNAASWVLDGGRQYVDYDESTAADPFDAGAVWRHLSDRYDTGTAYEMFRLYARLHRVAVAPLRRSRYDGSVSVADPGDSGPYRSRRAGVGPFAALYGKPDGVAAIMPRNVEVTGVTVPLAPVPGVAYSDVFGEPFDPAGVRALVEPDVTTFSSWVTGDTYYWEVRRVTPDVDGRYPYWGDVIDARRGYYGSDHVESGLAAEVVDCIQVATTPAPAEQS